MTSSTSTGRCPSFIVPPSRTNRIPSGSRKRMWWELDPEPFKGRGQLLRVVERPSVGVPPIGCPDLRVVARADDHGVTAEADGIAQVGRQQDPALLVHLRLDGVREHETLEQARLLVGDGQR